LTALWKDCRARSRQKWQKLLGKKDQLVLRSEWQDVHPCGVLAPDEEEYTTVGRYEMVTNENRHELDPSVAASAITSGRKQEQYELEGTEVLAPGRKNV
jgi:hypothetical protein